MNKQKAFTLIESMIIIAIVGILAAVVVSSLSTTNNSTSTFTETFTTGGTLCKGGMLFNRDIHGYQQQVIGPNGGGVSC